MSRDGWLQFSIMAKDCNLQHAIQLCRNWSEFSDLSLLAMWQYFPASNWDSWGVNTLTQQLQQFGFFPYFADYNARTITRYDQSGNRSAVRRQHDMIEARNILVGSMKRNDPVTRRFLQYLLMRAGEVLVMVRDGKTGRVITAPPKEHLWTYRKKAGLGRAARNEWENILEMGPEFMKLTDQLREWRFGFNDFYDVYIWDLKPGQDEVEIFNKDLRNAWRMKHTREMYNHMVSLLRSLHRDDSTGYTRQIKPGEHVESIWDAVMDERSIVKMIDVAGPHIIVHDDDDVEESLYMFYNEGNEAEDAVLFPDESTRKNFAFREISNGARQICQFVTSGYKQSLHAGDLEPGCSAKYDLLQKTLQAMLQTTHSGPTDWVLYIASILDWLNVRGDYKPEEYTMDGPAPWPHSFIVQDLVEAFVTMAMFFPGLEVTKFVIEFVNSSQCEEFRNSGVFDIEERNKARPDRRTGAGYTFREKEFWNEWNEFYNDDEEDEFWPERYLMEWSLTVRPTLAHFYKAGVITPPQPKRSLIDLASSISSSTTRNNTQESAKSIHLLRHPRNGQKSSRTPSPLPVLTQLHASPSCVPGPHRTTTFMCDGTDRYSTTFLDSRNRSWAWRFVPKNMTASEYSPHETIKRRLGYLKHQFGSRVINRGDLILVMGEDEDDLFKYCITVTLAIQTKPWMWEIDLWKSFINVDMDFIERMEEHWLKEY
ncbi:unnamed protein product [Fusarium graminearum]|uniref:Uncharacterized protein n=1 Tax=Gibberella zeae TaxID=5518 RepID=A0A9N8R4X9_GIBZA|nr:unnamed protein product [Fusarium graminearum]